MSPVCGIFFFTKKGCRWGLAWWKSQVWLKTLHGVAKTLIPFLWKKCLSFFPPLTVLLGQPLATSVGLLIIIMYIDTCMWECFADWERKWIWDLIQQKLAFTLGVRTYKGEEVRLKCVARKDDRCGQNYWCRFINIYGWRDTTLACSTLYLYVNKQLIKSNRNHCSALADSSRRGQAVRSLYYGRDKKSWPASSSLASQQGAVHKWCQADVWELTMLSPFVKEIWLFKACFPLLVYA